MTKVFLSADTSDQPRLREGDYAVREERRKCLVGLALRLLSNRAKSLAVLVAEPPGKYARAMSVEADEAQAAMDQMRREWQDLLAMEQAKAIAPLHCAPVQAMQWRGKTPVRLMFLAFEQDQFRVKSKGGQSLLCEV